MKEIHILKATSSLLVYTYFVFCLLKMYVQFEKKNTFLRQKGGRINSYSNGYFYVINTINKPACHGNITLSNLICNSHFEVSLVENPITLLYVRGLSRTTNVIWPFSLTKKEKKKERKNWLIHSIFHGSH